MLKPVTLALCAIGSLAMSEEVAVFNGGIRLAATYEAIDAPLSVAVILPGSGPTDRNGNSLAGLNTDTYALLAQGLAAQGVATIRADKRGLGGSTGDGNSVLLSDYASDAGLWMDALRQRTGLSCVWLIGHSEGGLVAMQTALARNDACGLVLLATPGRGLDEILIEQLSAAPQLAPHIEDIKAFLLRLKAGEAMSADEMPEVLANVLPPAVHGFFADAMRFDPIDAAGQISLPVLVIQGERDLQTKPVDARALDAAFPNSMLVTYPDMTHMLKSALNDTIEANLQTYSDPSLHLAPGLTIGIADFMKAQK